MKLPFESVTLLAVIFLTSSAWCADNNNVPVSTPDTTSTMVFANCIQDPHATEDEKEDEKMIASLLLTLNKLLADDITTTRQKPLNYARIIRRSPTSDTFPATIKPQLTWPDPLSAPSQKERKQ